MSQKTKHYIYGRHPVMEAIRMQPQSIRRIYLATGRQSTRLKHVLEAAQQHRIPTAEVTQRTLSDLVGEVHHQGFVAHIAQFEYASVDEILDAAQQRDQAPLIVALDQIQDPQNLGSIIRSSVALGAHGIILTKKNSCGVTSSAIRASAGATNHIPIAHETNMRQCLDLLKKSGLWIVGTHLEGEVTPDVIDFIQPTVLVIGSEGKGLRPLVAKTCDLLCKIPMEGQWSSLNAGAAAAVCLYEALRQRKQA
jgi:23S rRNA (guanosine2251-2'-O)-methyltransferase